MDVSLASWFVILLAVCAANLPFANERLFAAIALKRPAKPLWMRLLELIALYFTVGILARVLEARAGNAAPQNWEFYAVTACLFLVLAFPGFVYRYLGRHKP
ncbi:MAG: hypothetical protein JWP36_1966 [Paucimonas sp.]|nr:hypothetical protein [Paucimonas sp.]